MNRTRLISIPTLLLLAAAIWSMPLLAQTNTTGDASSPTNPESKEATQDGTVFGSMTVEAENKIRITFARPKLHVDIDPENAPGLQWGSAMDILLR